MVFFGGLGFFFHEIILGSARHFGLAFLCRCVVDIIYLSLTYGPYYMAREAHMPPGEVFFLICGPFTSIF